MDGPVQAHHVRLGTGGGIGLKPSDAAAVPLCPHHHRVLHQIGQRTFDTRFGLCLQDIAYLMAQASPHLKETEYE